METRRAAVAGSFYPAGKAELEKELVSCFAGLKGNPIANLAGAIVPHAGIRYSGRCAAALYSRIPKKKFKTIVILGPNHTGLAGAPVSVSPADFWETPLGKVQLDAELREKLGLPLDSLAHLREHSIEIQLPFLQRSLGSGFSILPIVISQDSLGLCETVGKRLAEIVNPEKTLVLASSDMNHFESPEETGRKDKLAIAQLLKLSPSGLCRTVRDRRISMCGILPAAALLGYLRAIGARKAELLSHCTSGDIIPSDEVVGYASVAFSRKR